MTLPRLNFARIGTLTYLYADACQRCYDDYLACNERISEIGEVEYDSQLLELDRRRDIAGVQTIVFAGMCFESAIYEYAADHLGDAYVQQHIDKLDVLSKWLIVLRLVDGYELRKDQAPYAALKALVSARNGLVHSKSRPLDSENVHAQLTWMKAYDEKHATAVTNAYRALLLMSVDLEFAIGVSHNPLPSYNPEVTLGLDTPLRLKSVVSECRAIVCQARETEAASNQ
jgi:hypothetical protein